MSTPARPETDLERADHAAEAPLRSLVRAALAADEPGDVPPFAEVYAVARRRHARAEDVRSGSAPTRGIRRPYLFTGALASVGMLALALVIVRPWSGAPEAPLTAREDATALGVEDAAAPDTSAAARDPDYVAALALRRSMRTGTPLDAMLASLPGTVARGLPALPEYRYPLLPEDASLGAASPTRNPS